MLVLSRRPNEHVRLIVPPSTEPVEIDVALVRIGPNTARLGFTAPRDVRIHREENLHLYTESPEPVTA